MSLLLWRKRHHGSSAGAADAYAVGGFEPEFVADFAGVLNSGTEYYRSGGSDTTFEGVFTHSGLVAPATMTDSDGSLKWAPHNFLVDSVNQTTSWSGTATNITTAAATTPSGVDAILLYEDSTTNQHNRRQNVAQVSGGGVFVFSAVCKAAGRTKFSLYLFEGGTIAVDFDLSSVTATAVGTATGTIEALSDGWYFCKAVLTIPSTATSEIFYVQLAETTFRTSYSGDGVSGVYVGEISLRRSDLGGMVSNPDRGDSYVSTTTAARFLPRRNHHVYNGTSWENAGILIEPAAATNLLLNSGTLSTQSVTVTAVAHTLHFTGTGTITLSGASTAGPLVGTGTGENNRVSLTFTPSAGSLTCTVSGTVTNAQLEVGSVPTSYIHTAGNTVTRAAETLTVAGANLPYSATAMSFQQQGHVNFADNDTLPTVVFFDWRVVSPAADVGHRLQTNGTNTGLLVGYSRGSESLNISDDYVPGINVPYSNASRHTTSTVQAAKQGSAFAANGAASSQNVAAGTLRFGATNTFVSRSLTVGLFRAWGTDIGESGIEEAST